MLSSLYRALLLLVLFALWCLPFNWQPHGQPIPTFETEFLTFGLVSAFVFFSWLYIAQQSKKTKITLSFPIIAWLPIAFITMLALQAFVLPLLGYPITQPRLIILGIIYGIAMFAMVQTGAGLVRAGMRNTLMQYTAVALVIGGLVMVLCLIAQLFHWEKYFPFSWIGTYVQTDDRRLFANMYQPNHAATYLVFSCAASLYLWQLRRIRWPLWLALNIFLCIGLSLTQSRTPWLQIIFVSGISSLSSYAYCRNGQHAYKRSYQYSYFFPALLPLLFALTSFLINHGNALFNWHLASSAIDRFSESSQLTPRLALWHYAFNIFKTHPWFGTGWGEFVHAQYALVNQLGTVEMANNAHNLILDLLSKIGIIGTLAMALPFLIWFKRLWSLPQSPTAFKPGQIELAHCFAISLIGILLIHTMLEYPQHYAFFLLPIMLLMGITETHDQANKKEFDNTAPTLHSTFYFFKYYGLQLTIGLVGIAALPFVWNDYQHTVDLYHKGISADKKAAYQRDPSILFSEYAEFALTSILPIDKNNLAYKLKAYEQALTLSASNTLLSRYIVLLALAQRPQEALLNFEKLKTYAEDEDKKYQELLSLCKAPEESIESIRPFCIQLKKLIQQEQQTQE